MKRKECKIKKKVGMVMLEYLRGERTIDPERNRDSGQILEVRR